MTQLDVLYRFAAQPSEHAVMALGHVREVYGIRHVALNEREKTIRVEYDATRLTEAVVRQLIRRCGIELVEQVSLLAPEPPAEPVAAPTA
jgi:hypothetical protein